MAKFPYIEYVRDENSGCHSGQKVHRPLLGIMLENGGKFSIEMFALLDSGADYCLFPYQFLEELGIEKAGLGVDFPLGMAEGHTIYFATVTLHVMGMEESGEIEAGFTEYLDGKGMAVLGHNGFFDRYKVMFNRPNFSFEILP
jgi:hypothetical protein